MRVLVLFTTSQIGGAERSLTRMALNSDQITYELATLGGEGIWCDWVRKNEANPIVFGPSGYVVTKMFGGAVWRVISYARSHHVDVIYVCGTRASLALRFLRVFLPGVKLVHGVRWNPDSGSHLDRFFRAMEKRTHGLVDSWVTNSQAAADTLVRRCGISDSRVTVIYNGIKKIPPASIAHSKRPLELLTVANLNPRKGHRQYLQVIGELYRLFPELKCVFVGRDDMNGEIERKIRSAGLENVVQCVGYQKDVSQWYRRAQVFVLPSLYGEGCPTSILEAFAHGIPVVASDIDGISELVDHGANGLLVKQGDTAGFLDAIKTLLCDEELAAEMGAEGRRKIASGFMVEQCAELHRAHFMEIA